MTNATNTDEVERERTDVETRIHEGIEDLKTALDKFCKEIEDAFDPDEAKPEMLQAMERVK